MAMVTCIGNELETYEFSTISCSNELYNRILYTQAKLITLLEILSVPADVPLF